MFDRLMAHVPAYDANFAADGIMPRMTADTSASRSDMGAADDGTREARHPPQLPASAALYAGIAVSLVAGLLLFYGSFYSIHHDLAGSALSAQLAVSLGPSFSEYNSYFPPAERAWFSLAVLLSELTGLRLDPAVISMTGAAVMLSAGLAYRIRLETVGASWLFLIASIALLVILPILLKNVFGLREHMVVLGLWPYVVLRISDPGNTQIGSKTRLLLGLWLGATLLFKYFYSLIVLLLELADAAMQRQPLSLLRIENVLPALSLRSISSFGWCSILPNAPPSMRWLVPLTPTWSINARIGCKRWSNSTRRCFFCS